MGPPKILVIDDAPIMRRMFRDVLAYAGYAVQTTSSAGEGLAVSEAEPPDLIIMDCHMPGMNGLEAVGRLRKHPRTWDIPVLGVTGGMAADLNELLAAGYTACLIKPIGLDKLYEIIEAALEHGRRTRSV